MTANSVFNRYTVRAAHGRVIEVLAGGPPDGLALVFHTGTPAGLVPFEPMTAAASARGLRTVLYSRPGYGGSTPEPGRKVADAAADVTAILDHLGVREFVTAGWSGGGPHALACAALLPGRCLAAASLAGVAPFAAEGLDWLAGMAAENVTEFGAALEGAAVLTGLLEEWAKPMREVTGDQVAESLGGLVTAPDVAALTGEFADFMAKSTRAALSTGIAGWRDDDLAFASDWGFGLAMLDATPVSVWQGSEDAMVPFGHGEWLAKHIAAGAAGAAGPSGSGKQTGAHLLPGEGHLTLVVNRYGDILDELLEQAGR